MKILFCGGGTAGHVYPAIAMAEIIKSKYKDAEFMFIGRRGGSENDIPRSLGIPVALIDSEGINRKSPIKAVRGIFKSLMAISEAKRIIKEFSPGIVIGTGGYVTWPVITAAKKARIKTVIHESNAYPGLVTRMLAPKCDATVLGFKSADEHLKRAKRVLCLGNPTREAFKTITRDDARRRLGIPKSVFLVVSFGGSLGAEVMNDVIADAMTKLSKENASYIHIHATGKRFYQAYKEKHPELIKARGSRIVPYIENVPIWFSAADLAITRSGAITTAELMSARLPSILIPSPNVADDHQSANARAMERFGGAIVIKEEDLTADSLANVISNLMKDGKRLTAMKSVLSDSDSRGFGKEFLALFDELYPF